MAWIEVISPAAATGELKQQYEQTAQRAGKVWNIIALMSQNLPTMKASLELCGAILYGPSELSRAQREMLAIVVSVENQCVY